MTEPTPEQLAADLPHPWLPVEDVTDANGKLLQLGVLGWLQLDANHAHAAVAETCRRAAADYCESMRPDLWVTDAEGVRVFAASGRIVVAGLLATSRLYGRRTSPLGAAYAELGGAEMLRHDPDVAQQLGVGRHANPVVGWRGQDHRRDRQPAGPAARRRRPGRVRRSRLV